MTAKDKAKELVDKFMSIDNDSENFDGFKMGFFYAQRCALIAVDEIILSLDYDYIGFERQNKYYKEVKQEIELL